MRKRLLLTICLSLFHLCLLHSHIHLLLQIKSHLLSSPLRLKTGDHNMGNCQAIDAAALVIQHPNGRMERMYWSVTASEVMKLNPGHHVSLIIPLPPVEEGGGEHNSSSDDKTVRFTRVKLLRPEETLVLGRAYRLVTTQEVMKVLKAKKYAKMKRNQAESMNKSQPASENQDSGSRGADEKRKSEQSNCQVTRRENHHPQRPRGANSGGVKSKSWKPSLQSISEAAS